MGYRMVADENIDPGRYGFKLLHESDRSHFFSSDEQMVIREWMRSLMKATIDRDYTSVFSFSLFSAMGSNVCDQSPWYRQSMCPPFPWQLPRP